MPPAAKSISAANLAKLTQAAVKAATEGRSGKFIGRGPTIGYVPKEEQPIAAQLELAAQITSRVRVNARAAGIAGLKPKPAVVVEPGRITIGFIAAELAGKIRGVGGRR
jgi:hypothetical protein